MAATAFPFVALVGQEAMREALLLNVVDPRIGGVMIMGHRGTAKTTAVRGLQQLLPDIEAMSGCPLRCDPAVRDEWCEDCRRRESPEIERVPVPLVDLPLGATEDRVAGTLDLEAALVRGSKVFAPGLLAAAHRGFLYIDEVNLLDDHLVDLLLDVAASGINRVERESISLEHPARFVLVGSGNPEEGELRPQLLDRFGLSVAVETETDPERRRLILRRRLEFDDDPREFARQFDRESEQLARRILIAREGLHQVRVEPRELDAIASLNAALAVDGHRGELAFARACRARAALAGRDRVDATDLHATAGYALRHRIRIDPLALDGVDRRLAECIDRCLPAAPAGG